MKTPLLLLTVAALSGLLLTQCETAGAGGGLKMGGQRFSNMVGMTLVPVPGTKISMATTEVTVAQWQASGLPYQTPYFAQDGNHPAAIISWNDAQKYCRWLSKKEGRSYRLPTDHEWSCAVGIGHLENASSNPQQKDGVIKNAFPYGSGHPSGRAGNYLGAEASSVKSGEFLSTYMADYNDGYVYTAPVGSYAPNKLGIYDMGGNVWEWCQDKYAPSSNRRVLRGASCVNAASDYLLSS